MAKRTLFALALVLVFAILVPHGPEDASTTIGSVSADSPAAAAGAAPPAPAVAVDMAGRWRLAVPGSPSCGMHFGGGPGIQTGAIQPEGGCPGQFFTARHWQLAKDGQLTIDDYQMNPLAELQLAGAGNDCAGIGVGRGGARIRPGLPRSPLIGAEEPPVGERVKAEPEPGDESDHDRHQER